MAGVEAMCMRSVLGSGCLLAASPAWVVSVEETALKKRAGREEQVKRAVETSWRWKVAKASSK